MGPEERAEVVTSLPNEVTDREMSPPEGDRHQEGKHRTLDVLRGFFRHRRRKVYVGSELPIYYPGERRFAPDLLVVFDVEPHSRGKWLVSHEGKGLDWVMEVHEGGDRKKDAEFNVARYARLGIPEYFIYDRSREQLLAYRLKTPRARTYTPIKPRKGRFTSKVLGLEFELRDDKLLIWSGEQLLLESIELADRLQEKLETVQQRADAEARARRKEARLRREAEKRLAAAEAELQKLRRRQH
ncbi:Uma2 family endonuclease [Pyxidicoccus fallax]|uniref:Uma2 family endonuclease n=1 Tax=Pyxidicoccus fallax TaxID=394095 RepID=A0A848L825_9BACT|nr:Uma2 family endonuclease [Pyxidicoccus fallax]NMO14716.1 Uma2 family endonuclease [Pyxidicoccus fallax]NPC85155.1 Uma2 family endonuclease [Pyxidicoccus fallax]